MIIHTVSELARICGAVLDGDGQRTVVGPASLGEAGPEEISFLGDPRYAGELETTRAAAVLVPHALERSRSDLTFLRCDDPSRAFTRVVETFRPAGCSVDPGVHPRAVIEVGARLAPTARVGALSYIGRDAELGEDVVIHPGVTIGPECRIGAGTVIRSGAVLYERVCVGARCLIHGGAVLGADGFGFDPAETGWVKIPQCGTVLVGDDVEIGAACTIDRARFGATRILDGSKLDNQVHVGHNCTIGPEALLVAQVGISGSCKVGRRVMMGGQAATAGHVTIGDGARIGGRGAAARDLEGGKDYLGSPARPKLDQIRQWKLVERLPVLEKRVRELERRLAKGSRPEGPVEAV